MSIHSECPTCNNETVDHVCVHCICEENDRLSERLDNIRVYFEAYLERRGGKDFIGRQAAMQQLKRLILDDGKS